MLNKVLCFASNYLNKSKYSENIDWLIKLKLQLSEIYSQQVNSYFQYVHLTSHVRENLLIFLLLTGIVRQAMTVKSSLESQRGI